MNSLPRPALRLLALIAVISLFSSSYGARKEITDIVAAREWCDSTMMHRVEGIWEFPEDETTVLICRSEQIPHQYDIVVVATPDTRLKPGETIGYLKESPETDKFEMALCRMQEKGVFSELSKCLAQLRDNDNTIVAKGRKLKFSLRNRWLLPSFWKMISLTLKDPLENLPRGLIRIYPENSRQPDYL